MCPLEEGRARQSGRGRLSSSAVGPTALPVTSSPASPRNLHPDHAPLTLRGPPPCGCGPAPEQAARASWDWPVPLRQLPQGQPVRGGPAPPLCASWEPPLMSPCLEKAGYPLTAPQNVAASLPRSPSSLSLPRPHQPTWTASAVPLSLPPGGGPCPHRRACLGSGALAPSARTPPGGLAACGESAEQRAGAPTSPLVTMPRCLGCHRFVGSPPLFLFLQTVLAIPGPPHCHINSRISNTY